MLVEAGSELQGAVLEWLPGAFSGVVGGLGLRLLRPASATGNISTVTPPGTGSGGLIIPNPPIDCGFSICKEAASSVETLHLAIQTLGFFSVFQLVLR